MQNEAMKIIRILLVDDHAVVRSGIQTIMANEKDIEITGEAETGKQALALIKTAKPDVVVMDIGLSDMSGIEATKKITERYPGVKVVALTIHEDEEYFFKMLEVGASGYVSKRAAPEELVMAIRAAAINEIYINPPLVKLLVQDYFRQSKDRETQKILTPREDEVLAYLAEGVTNRKIGKELLISPKTVARHRENIMRKLNLHNRTELVKYAIRKGIIRP